MRLVAITCSRYRAFREKIRIELPPIVLIIGKNGSGKSVITRLPLLIAQSVSATAEGPIDLSAGGVQHSSSFIDLINGRSALPFSLGAEVADGTRSYSFETSLTHVNETKSLVIDSFKLLRNSELLLSVELEDPSQLVSQSPQYRISHNNTGTTAPVEFTGLLPKLDTIFETTNEELVEAYRAIRVACPPPSYLGPFRQEPSQGMRMPNQNIRSLGPRGEFALELLADDRLRHGGKLSQQVGNWFGEKLGQELSVDVTGDQPRVRVQSSAGIELGLADTGAGFSQCIPIVVQNLAYREGRISSPILIVEQPELHLHPAAHGALADLIVESSVLGDGTPRATSIVETHSEQLIMRIRRRIAERKIDRAVTLLSVGHREPGADSIEPIRAIKFDEEGNPDAWPEGVFEETFKDLAAIHSL